MNTNTSGYRNVTYHKTQKGWQSYITVDGKRKHLGSYKTAIDAAIAYNQAALKYLGDLVRFNDIPNWRNIIPEKRKAYEGLVKNNTSGYANVAYDKSRQKWLVYIQVNKKRVYLGRFKTAREGAIAYNKAAIKYFGKSAWLNHV